jgi:hypothetical protein
LADEFVWCEAAQGLEPTRVVVGIDEERQVRPELVVAVVVVALDGRVLDRAVHPLDLTIGPRMVHLGQAMLDAVLVADPVEDVLAVPDVLLAGRELDAVVGQQRVDPIGHGRDQVAQELCGFHLAGALDQAGEGDLRGSIDRHEQAQLALGRLHLGQVKVEVADRVGGEALLGGLVTIGLGQAADAMPLQAAMQAGAGQVWDARLQAVKAVVQRQQGMPAEGDDDGLVLRREHRRARLLRPHAAVAGGPSAAPLLHGGGADAVAFGRRSHTLLT